MSDLKRITIVGASGRTLGVKTTESFLSHPQKFQVSVLTSEKSLKDEKKAPVFKQLERKGASIVCTEFDDPAQLAKALEGTQVVLCLVSGNKPEELKTIQLALIEACKKAGVQRYITSDFGLELSRIKYGDFEYYNAKKTIQETLESQSDIEYTFVSTGTFAEFLLGPYFGVDIKGRKLASYGPKEMKISTTHSDDIAKFLPEIVLSPKSKNARIQLASFTTTWDEIKEACEKVTEEKFEQVVLSEEEIRRTMDANPFVLAKAPHFTKLCYINGTGYIENPFNTTDPILSKIQTVSVEDVIRRQL